MENEKEKGELEAEKEVFVNADAAKASEMIPDVQGKPIIPVETGYQCDQCQKSYKNLKSFSSHKKLCGKVTAACHLCQKTFKSVRYLKIHVRNIHQKVPQYKCDQCQLTFRTEAKLKSHRKDHNIVCDICQKPFQNRDSLKSHIRKSHKKIKSKKVWSCPVCPHKLGSDRGLRYHLQLHKAGEEDGDTEEVSFHEVIEEDSDTVLHEIPVVLGTEEHDLNDVLVEVDHADIIEDSLAENIIF